MLVVTWHLQLNARRLRSPSIKIYPIPFWNSKDPESIATTSGTRESPAWTPERDKWAKKIYKKRFDVFRPGELTIRLCVKDLADLDGGQDVFLGSSKMNPFAGEGNTPKQNGFSSKKARESQTWRMCTLRADTEDGDMEERALLSERTALTRFIRFKNLVLTAVMYREKYLMVTVV